MSGRQELGVCVSKATSCALEVVEKAKRESIGAKKTGLAKGPSVATPVAATAAVYAERAAAAERALVRLRADVSMRLAAAADKLGEEEDGRGAAGGGGG